MMRLLLAGAAAWLVLGLLVPAAAHPPPELADYVGARAGQASGGLDALGYVNVQGSYWWNAGDIPRVALSACMASADAFRHVTPGTSMVNNGHTTGKNWVLSMASGTYKSTCTVSAMGKVIDMDPG